MRELQITTTLHCICDRCAQAFDQEKSTDYACVLAEERQSDEDDDIVLLDDDEVDVTELARDAFILDMDTKFLCREPGVCSSLFTFRRIVHLAMTRVVL